MGSLVAAALGFAGIHLLVSGTRLRDGLVQRLGETTYRGLFSLASVALLGWLIVAYGKVRQPELSPLFEHRGIAAALLLVAFVFIILGLLTPSPGVVGGERLLEKGFTASGIHRITRHPFLWGVALWAAVHAIYNPGAAHGVFFGTFLLVAVAGTMSIDAKRARLLGAPWVAYAATTSNMPFLAILEGRNRLAPRELTLWKPAIGVLVFVAFMVFHGRFFGVPMI